LPANADAAMAKIGNPGPPFDSGTRSSL